MLKDAKSLRFQKWLFIRLKEQIEEGHHHKNVRPKKSIVEKQEMSFVDSRLSVNKVLTVIGSMFVWTPLIFPLVLSVIKLIESGVFLFDFLMPAEMFPLFLSGAVLLFWVSLRTKYYVKHIGFGLLSAVVFLFGGQGLAVLTGLARET